MITKFSVLYVGQIELENINANLAIACQDANEFKAWWERDAQAIAATIKTIGEIEEK